MKKRQKISTIGALLCSACLAISVGVATLDVSAQTATTPISSLISADSVATVSKKEITATHYSRANTSETNNGTGYTYSGLAVESNVAYEGEFSGVFTGDTTLEYKFYGKNPWTLNKIGTNIGDFYFTITSVAEPSQWVKMNITAGNPALSEYNAYKTSTYFTGSFGDNVLYYQNNIVQNKTLSNMSHNQGLGPVFLSDSINANNKLYIEIDESGTMSLYYQQIEQGTNGVLSTNQKSKNMVVLNAGSTSEKNLTNGMDWSEGYTISFGSNVDTTKTYKYSTSSATTTDGGTDVCFISLNGNALNTDTIEVTGETSAMLDDTVLDETETYTVFQGAEPTYYTVMNSSVYDSDYTDFDGTTKNGSFTMKGKTKVGTLDTAELGNGKTFEVNGKTYTYNVIKGEKGSDLVDINVETDGVSAEYQLHTGDNVASAYDGLTITANEAYTGSFDGTFNGNTLLEYKFPGTTSINAAGDALGDFYFEIVSVNNPEHWIKVHIAQRQTGASSGIYYANTSLIYATTSLDVNEGTAFTLQSGTTYQHQNLDKNVSVWNTNAPKFRSDKTAGSEKLYIETTEDGFLYVYYQQNGVKSEKPIIAFEKFDTNEDGKYDETASAYDNYVTDLFDFSKGYTISFGSDFDVNTNFSTTVAEDVMPDDAGTDVCFISVNGVQLNDSYNVINFTDSVSYDGEVVDGAVDISASDAESKSFVVATTATGGDYTVAGVGYPFNYTKTAEVDWSKDAVVDDTLVLQTDIFGNRAVTVLTTSVSGKTYTLVVNGTSTPITTSNETVTLETQVLEGKAFIGWTISSEQDKLYPANYEYTVVDGDTLTAVFVAFDMADGASIRKATPYGLRFVSGYDTTDFATIEEYATVGTLIVPTDTLNGLEINHTNFVAGETSLDVAGDKKLTEEAAQMALDTEDYSADYTYYTGTISNLKEANFARAFSARAYIKVTYANESEVYFYSDYDEENCRSAYDVAVAAKEAGETGTAIDKYIAQTKDLTITNVDTTEYESATKITSVRVNNVWVSKTEGAIVQVGGTNYNVTYNYNEATAKLTLTFAEAVES